LVEVQARKLVRNAVENSFSDLKKEQRDLEYFRLGALLLQFRTGWVVLCFYNYLELFDSFLDDFRKVFIFNT